jgi:hypothetical protein
VNPNLPELTIETYPLITDIYYGYIYFFRASNGLVKIGRTSEVVRRLRILNACSPLPIEFIHCQLVYYPERVERSLHVYYKTFRSHGEWFRIDDALIQEGIKLLENAKRLVELGWHRTREELIKEVRNFKEYPALGALPKRIVELARKCIERWSDERRRTNTQRIRTRPPSAYGSAYFLW